MSSPLISRMQPFGTTIFAEMSALATRTGAINLGQGFPDTDGPARDARGREGRDRRRAQPVPARPRRARAARRRSPRTRSASTGCASTRRRRCSSRSGRPRRSRRSSWRCASRATRSSRSSPTTTRYAATIALAGATRRTSVLRFPDFAVDEASLRAAFSYADAARPAQHAAQPDGQGLHPRRARARRRAGARARRLGRHRRGLRAPRLRRRRARPHRDAARHGGADHHDLLGRQDVLGDGLEGRLADRAGRGGGRRSHRQAVPHLRRLGAVPAGRGPRARTRRRGVCRPARLAPGKARPAVRRPSSMCGLQVSRPSGTYFVIADAAPLGAVDGLEFARAPAGRSPASWACRCRCSTTTRRPRAP